jgi:hypothetical protein
MDTSSTLMVSSSPDSIDPVIPLFPRKTRMLADIGRLHITAVQGGITCLFLIALPFALYGAVRGLDRLMQPQRSDQQRRLFLAAVIGSFWAFIALTVVWMVAILR